MKKLIFILAILVSFSVSSQKYELMLNAKLTANTTSATQTIGVDNSWSIQLVWSGATGTPNATLYIEVSNDGTNWIPFASNSYLTVSGAAGTNGYDVGVNQMPWKFLRVRYVKGTTNSALIKVYLNQPLKKVQ